MAQKTKPKKINKNANEIRHLKVLLHYSLRAMEGQSEELDKLFFDQAARIRLKIKNLE